MRRRAKRAAALPIAKSLEKAGSSRSPIKVLSLTLFKEKNKMTRQNNDNKLEAVMELLVENGFDGFADVLRILLNEAMKIEREQTLGAQLYQRTDDRRGYANGYKPKTIDTRMGRLCVDIPQVRGDVDFYPSSLEKGCRSERALKLAIAEMYVKGISTRKVTDVLEKMCGLDITSVQVSRAAQMLDEQLSKWRNRPLGEYPYIMLDAHYEKVRKNGCVRDCAIFTAVGINNEGKREVLGVSVSLSEAETHWRAFLKSLKNRDLSGVKYAVSDDHDGIKNALKAEMTGVIWQRCQCHLQRNAFSHVPKVSMRGQVAEDLRDVFNAKDSSEAQDRLEKCVQKYAKAAPQLADWMQENIPDGLNVFALPKEHRKRMRTTNTLERLHQEIKRRARVARIFANEESLLRLVSAIEMEISDDWLSEKKYLTFARHSCGGLELENENGIANSNDKKIYRKKVA
jgi:putative transposase